MDPKEKEQLFQKLDALILDLAYEHQSIYYVLTKEDEGICYRENPLIPNGVKTGEVFPFQETAFAYGNTFVETKDKERFLQFVRLGNITKKLENGVVLSCAYQAVYHNQTASHTMRIMRTIVDKKEAFLVCIANDEKTANDLLQEAKDKDRKRNEGLRRIMHEIRAPLDAIVGLNAMALKEKGLSAKIRNYLNRIKKAASYILSIINDALDIEKIEEGKGGIREEPFCLSGMVGEVTSLLETKVQQKDIRLEIKIDPTLEAYYLGDVTKIKEVLINILSNAIHHSKEGKRVSLVIAKKKERLCFCIRDEGEGIKTEKLEKIFEPFWQEKEEKGSSGLGLYLSKQLVNAMKGALYAESKPDKGTTFTILLPLKIAKEIKKEKKRSVDLKGVRVLAAEDIDINREILSFQLREKGVLCDLVSNGQEALERFKKSEENEYDLILMDVHMPIMDGISAAKQIRKLERKDNDLPIVAISADGFEEDEEESRKAGMNVHLRKPVDPNLLYETIQRLLDL